MGFSVSGATAIIFVGLFISFGVFYTSASNGLDRVNAAYQANEHQVLAQQNTAVNVTHVAYDGTSGTVNVTVVNTGATSLTVNGTDLLVNNTYEQHPFLVQKVNGNSKTDLWLPGETLHVNVSVSSKPSRFKVVTDTGVAVTEAV